MRWTRHLSPSTAPPLPRPTRSERWGGKLMWTLFSPGAWRDWGGTERLRLRRHRVVLPRLPASLSGLRIAWISDVHAGAYARRPFLVDALQQLASLRCDLVVGTGDYVTHRASELRPLIPQLSALRGPLGGVFILGNHDYCDARAVARTLTDAGWDHLRGRSLDIAGPGGGPGLRIVGYDDLYWGDGHVSRAFEQLRGWEGASLMLMHAPDDFHELAEEGVGVALCGHTHGGQIRFGTRPQWVPTGHGHRWTRGRYRLLDSQLLVNEGLGSVVVRWRRQTTPEIVELTLLSPTV